MRTRPPVFARVLLELQTGKAEVLICDDASRIARDERDALHLIDACELGDYRLRLCQLDIADLLRAPELRPDVDVKALRAEASKLHAKRVDLARLLSKDMLTKAGVRQESKRIDARLADISRTRRRHPDQPETRIAPGADLGRVWKELSLVRQREMVRLLCEVTLVRGRMRQPFDPRLQMRIDWRQ